MVTFFGLSGIKFTIGMASVVAAAVVSLISSDKAHAVSSTLTDDLFEVASVLSLSSHRELGTALQLRVNDAAGRDQDRSASRSFHSMFSLRRVVRYGR